MQIQINYGARTVQYDNNDTYNTPFSFRSVSDMIIEMSIKIDNVITKILTMDFLFFYFYFICSSLHHWTLRMNYKSHTLTIKI